MGQHDEAWAHLNSAREIFDRQRLRDLLVECDIILAEIHLARGKFVEVAACLERARGMAEADGLETFVAICDRLLAQTDAQRSDRPRAFKRVENARALFLKQGQTVDAALCDLTEGDLHFESDETGAARECFERARSTLSPAFPDQAWRADYGLGRCVARFGDSAAALDHYLRAVRTIAASRSALVTERLSNDFFTHRQSVFDEALAIARRQGAAEAALGVIEAGKARTFLALIQNQGWKIHHDRADPYAAQLIEREKKIRYELNSLRGRVAVQSPAAAYEPLRGADEVASISAAALQELNALSRQYESVVTQLRLAATGLAGVSAPEPFALDQFRAAANAAFGADWTALDYSLADDAVVIAIFDSQDVKIEQRPLSQFDRAILDQCASPESDWRELIYRGTMHGERVPSPGSRHLRHLHRLLIPERLDAETLMISPHRALHALPFHALIAPRDDSHLIERHAVVYAPSLQVMQHLLGETSNRDVKKALVVGVSDFGNWLRALPQTDAEVERLREVFDGHGKYLRGPEATREKMIEMNASGELLDFDVVHFATHAILDRAAPHQSRVVLSDDALTIADILDFTLDAQLVALSACQTALGNGGLGDELIGLARTFFYAGARSLLATLWQVEDGSMAELVGQFYRRRAEGVNSAQALRGAQIEMIRAGCSPYQWAPLVLMGRP